MFYKITDMSGRWKAFRTTLTESSFYYTPITTDPNILIIKEDILLFFVFRQGHDLIYMFNDNGTPFDPKLGDNLHA